MEYSCHINLYTISTPHNGVYHRQKKKIMACKRKYMESVAVMMSDAIPHSFWFKMVASVIRVAYQIIKQQVQKINKATIKHGVIDK